MFAASAGAGAATIHVDPKRGSDAATGSRSQPLRSLDAAWRRLPARVTTRTVIELAAGSYRGRSPIYWEGHSGQRGAPIVIRSTSRRHGARLPAVNIFAAENLEFRDISFSDGGDVVHCERCKDFTLRRVRATGRGAQETVKINQSERIRILDSNLSGAGDNVIDLVAVSDAVIRGNTVSRAGDWCAYAKGGSVNVRVSSNRFTRCGTGGFSAGQGTGFQFMVPPWLQYEAIGVVVERNTVTRTEGAAFAVQGGFNVLVRDNVAREVGRRSHVLEALFGSRSCDGRPGDQGRERCTQYLAEGGWGTTAVDDGENYVRIPNRHVYFVENVIVNSDAHRSAWQQIEVPSDWAEQPGSNVPGAASAASDLRFIGNVVWNGSRQLPIGGDGGCIATNPTCNPDQLAAQNQFNRRKPTLRRGGSGYRKSGWVAAWHPYPTPAPDWSDLPAGTAPWSSWPR